MPQYHTDLNVCFLCTYQVVCCTEYRRKLITEQVEARLKEIATQVAEETHCRIGEMQAAQDHFHLLVECDPQCGMHRFVKAVKGHSSRLLRQAFAPLKSRVPTLWANRYFMATVGGAPLSLIKQYIENKTCLSRRFRKLFHIARNSL